MTRRARRWLPPVVALLLVACREERPSHRPVPRASGPLRLQVRHPAPNDPPTATGRDYVMGATGNGDAEVTVDGQRADVLPNGAFIAYVRAPAPGASYTIRARLGVLTSTVAVPVATRAVADTPSVVRAASGDVVTVPLATELGLATEIPGREEPGGDYRWELLPGTRGVVTEARGDARHVRFTAALDMWVDQQLLRTASAPPRRTAAPAVVRVHPLPGATDVVISAPEPRPYDVAEGDASVTFTVYGVGPGDVRDARGGYVASIAGTSRDGALQLTLALRGPAYGYEVFHAGGAMVLRLRHPPVIDAVRPMAGLTVVVDAGHPPGGAVGPTGLAEPDVTLDVARRLEAILGARGAHVVMTRADTLPVSLDRRVAVARASNGHAFVSIHADAIASGADPSRDVGTAVYFARGHAAALATATRLSLGPRLELPDRGVRRGDYAVVRQTWLPAILCEGATMTVPAQEAALADSSFRAAYALGVADGLELYFRQLRQRTIGW